MIKRTRLLETVAMAMIGDGILVRALGVAESGAGLWLARRQWGRLA